MVGTRASQKRAIAVCSAVRCVLCFAPSALISFNWLQVFRRAHTTHLCSARGPERETSPVPSEKCVAHCGSEGDDMRIHCQSCSCAQAVNRPPLCAFSSHNSIG